MSRANIYLILIYIYIYIYSKQMRIRNHFKKFDGSKSAPMLMSEAVWKQSI